jgi:hypothetical protein
VKRCGDGACILVRIQRNTATAPICSERQAS